MYLAVNKLNTNEFHSFEWTQDNKLIICGMSVVIDEWDIVWVKEQLPC